VSVRAHFVLLASGGKRKKYFAKKYFVKNNFAKIILEKIFLKIFEK
jgi:hypothetical protein